MERVPLKSRHCGVFRLDRARRVCRPMGSSVFIRAERDVAIKAVYTDLLDTLALGHSVVELLFGIIVFLVTPVASDL